MNWLIIVVLVILAFCVLKVWHLKHKIFLVFIILAILFVYITAVRISAHYSINWKSLPGIENGIKIYFAWLGGVFDNFKTLTANAVKMDWAMENKTTTTAKLMQEKEK